MRNLHSTLGDRPLVVALIGLALLLKGLVPSGWMPVFENGSVTLELCGGWRPAPEPRPPAAQTHQGMDMSAHAPAASTDHQQHEEGGESGTDQQPCSFAAASLAWNEPDAAPAIAAPVARAKLLPARPVTAIGRGLAAPPPPSTGPPLLS